jgi:hypothetical protein
VLLWTRYWTYGLCKRRGISWLVEGLWCPQKELCNTYLLETHVIYSCTRKGIFEIGLDKSIECSKASIHFDIFHSYGYVTYLNRLNFVVNLRRCSYRVFCFLNVTVTSNFMFCNQSTYFVPNKLKRLHRDMAFVLYVIWHVRIFMNMNCLCLLSITIMYFVFNPISPAGIFVKFSLCFITLALSTAEVYYLLLYIVMYFYF